MNIAIAQRLIDVGMSGPEAHARAARFAEVEQQLSIPTGTDPLRWFVPGRIEVLGKHTDYAGGRSLLCAAERGFCVAAIPRPDSVVRINDVIRRKVFEFTLSPNLPVPASSWTIYPSVVARRLARNFPAALRGAEVAFANDLPSAAGMSTSSALVVAIFAVLSAINRLDSRPEYIADIHTQEDLAGYLGCIENGQTFKSLVGDGGVGTFGGSEDHTAILASQPGHLMQYSFCPVRLERTVKLPDDCVFVIGVSGGVADKTGSAQARYNRASQSVRSILDIWNSASGSNASTLAAAAMGSPDSPDRIRAVLHNTGSGDADPLWLSNRFDQFWLESEVIVPQAADALAHSDLQAFGKLVAESQSATENLLGNQVPETIWLAREARALGAHAASAFGAGFGGSVWALVARQDAEDFAQRWQRAYQGSPHVAARNSQFFLTAAGPPMVQL